MILWELYILAILRKTIIHVRVHTYSFEDITPFFFSSSILSKVYLIEKKKSKENTLYNNTYLNITTCNNFSATRLTYKTQSKRERYVQMHSHRKRESKKTYESRLNEVRTCHAQFEIRAVHASTLQFLETKNNYIRKRLKIKTCARIKGTCAHGNEVNKLIAIYIYKRVYIYMNEWENSLSSHSVLFRSLRLPCNILLLPVAEQQQQQLIVCVGKALIKRFKGKIFPPKEK